MSSIEHPLLVLTPRPWKWMAVFLGGAAFVAAGCWMLQDTNRRPNPYMAWCCVVFFGLVALVALLQLIPGTSRLVVTSSGLHVKTLLRSYTCEWADIERFGVAEWTQWHGPFRQRQRLIAFDYREGASGSKARRGLAELNSGLVGYHGALPDNYGYKHQELADLLNTYLKRFNDQRSS